MKILYAKLRQELNIYTLLMSFSNMKAYLSIDSSDNGSSNILADHDNAMNPLLAQKGFCSSSKVQPSSQCKPLPGWLLRCVDEGNELSEGIAYTYLIFLVSYIQMCKYVKFTNRKSLFDTILMRYRVEQYSLQQYWFEELCGIFQDSNETGNAPLKSKGLEQGLDKVRFVGIFCLSLYSCS